MTRLPVPEPGRAAALEVVAEHLGDLVSGPLSGSARFRGGQAHADAALAGFDVRGYAAQRNEVLPVSARGASGLSPYVRHGLLTLEELWTHVDDGPAADRRKFRDELLWQEYARHWYARLGLRTRRGLRNEQAVAGADGDWPRDMACVDATVGELERDGWLVNQTRMWLASQWAVRDGLAWRDGEDRFFANLLDGSRAANRLGWQWTAGLASSKQYGFSRYQVERRAPELCGACPHANACPIEGWPDAAPATSVDEPVAVRASDDLDAEAGPAEPLPRTRPDIVWLTAESLGTSDPALTAHPDLDVVFVFDEPLLGRLRLTAKRLVFLVETLAELAQTRAVELHRGDPAAVLAGHAPAVTFAPVPGFRRLAERLDPAVVHPWPWLRRPTGGSVRSFSAWRKATERAKVAS